MRTFARLLLSIGLLAASVAWAGWLYLHTAGDPNRGDRIAHAVLDDPSARAELSADIANGLAAAANRTIQRSGAAATGIVVSGSDPQLRAAVDASLADPRIADNLIDAISAEHAIALGAKPAHPAVIDTASLEAAVKAHLQAVDPSLANVLPPVASGEIKLPTGQIPLAKRLRTLAIHYVGVLALAAAAGVALAFLVGDRPRILRRAGSWAIGAGVTWAVLPPLITTIGDHLVKSQAAVIRAVVKGASAAVGATATTLAVIGVAAVVASYLWVRVTRTAGRAFRPGRPSTPVAAAAPVPGDSWNPSPPPPPTTVYTSPPGWNRRPGVRSRGDE